MDRSFLSDPAVIAASRNFVCVRLMSYENKDEAAFLKSFGASKSGELENTVFCILAPDGKRTLIKATRGPRGETARLAATMIGIAKDFPGKRIDTHHPELPFVADLRLAINVAACDHQPLVVIRAKDEATRKKMHEAIGSLAWNPELIGKFVYAEVALPKELDVVEGVTSESAVFVVMPDTYGLKGKVLSQTGADASSRQLAETLKNGLVRFQRSERNFWQHVKDGQRQGVFWETLTPVTDPMELRAREKGRTKP